MTRIVAAACLALAIAEASAPVRAWSPVHDSAPVWRSPVPFSLHERGSEDRGFVATERVVQRVFAEWDAVPCAALEVEYGGRTAAEPEDAEAWAVIGWEEQRWPMGREVVAHTVVSFIDGEIENAVMTVNGVDYSWAEGREGEDALDMDTVLRHEAGHSLGLGHSTDRSASMFPSYGIRGLGTDDEEGLCALYPEHRGGVDREIGTGVSSFGAVEVGQRGLGESCTLHGECASSLCIAEGGTERGQCTRACAEEPCPTGFFCEEDGALSLCIGEDWLAGSTCAAGGRGGRSVPVAVLALTCLVVFRRCRARRW